MALPTTQTDTTIKYLNPYLNPGTWGRMRVGGMYVPGIIESIDGAEKPERWVFQMGVSVNNAVSVWRGRMLAESIKIKTRLYDENSFNNAYIFDRVLNPKPGKRPPALAIVNAHVNFVGIVRVSRRNVIPPKSAAGLSWVFEFELCEYNPVKMAPVGPQEAPKAETENDRLAKQVQRLASEAAKL